MVVGQGVQAKGGRPQSGCDLEPADRELAAWSLRRGTWHRWPGTCDL